MEAARPRPHSLEGLPGALGQSRMFSGFDENQLVLSKPGPGPGFQKGPSQPESHTWLREGPFSPSIPEPPLRPPALPAGVRARLAQQMQLLVKADPRAGVGLGWDEGKLRPQGWSPPLVVRLAPESQICVPHCFRQAYGGAWGLGFMGLSPPESRGAGMGQGVVCGGRGYPSSRAPDLSEAARSSLGAALSAGPRLGTAVPGLAPSKRSWFSSLAGVHGVACRDWGASRTPCRPSSHTQARREEEAETQAGDAAARGWSSAPY